MGSGFGVRSSPPVRRWLLAQTDPETANAVLARLAPVARRAGEDAHATFPRDGNLVARINAWLGTVINHLLVDLAVRDLEIVALRAERDDLRAQLRAPRSI